MKFEFMHPADQLVEIMNRIYKYGMTTTSGGNLSIRDENGDIWITPSGIDKGSLTRADIMQVKPDGTVIGPHRPSVELPIHSNIYRLRPDVHAVVHAHPPAMVAFSLARKVPNTRLIPEVHQLCGDVAIVGYNPPGVNELGAEVAEKFGQGFNSAIMVNHGVVCGAKDMSAAFMAFEAITTGGRAELDALKLGMPRTLTDEELACAAAMQPEALAPVQDRVISGAEKAARRDICAMAVRCYNQRLFTGVQGVISMRMDDGSLLVTPHGRDRKSLTPGDIVWVKDGMGDSGACPSSHLALHRRIYEEKPWVKAVITAQPPAVMAFAVTGTQFDSHTASEGYIILGDVNRLDDVSLNPERVAALVEPRRAVTIVDNRCAVVAGESLMNAFDRLEVLEYSAAAVIAASELGALTPLSDAEIDHTKRALKLQ